MVAVAQLGHHVEAQAAYRGEVVAETLHFQAQPARDIRAAVVREARELGEIADGHDSRDDGHGDADCFAVVDEAEIGIGVEEILGDRRVGTGLELALEVREVVPGTARLGMEFRIAGDLNVEVIAGLLSNERDQFVRMAQFARARGAGGQVAAQGHHMVDALCPVQLEGRRDVGARRADAGDVRGGGMARGLDLEHRLERPVAGRAARPVGAGEEPGLELRELLPGRAQPLHPFRGFRRDELEAEGLRMLLL
jgi:hypothetical protein